MNEDSCPFDARKTLMCEDPNGSREKWRTTSLVLEITDVLQTRFRRDKSHEAAARRFKLAADELTRRGVDADALARYGMLEELLGPLLIALLVTHVLAHTELEEELVAAKVDVEGWRALLRIEVTEAAVEREHMTALLEQAISRVLVPMLVWGGRAPLSALLTLSVPSEEEFWAPITVEGADVELREKYRWLVERYTESYVNEWDKASLYLEYRYQRNLEPTWFPAAVLDDRRPPLSELEAEIAARAAGLSQPATNEAPMVNFPVHGMTDHARSLLEAGRIRDAAALFEFAVHQWPTEPAAHNNLAFCLIPENPAQALVHLQQAQRLKYQPLSLLAYNRACCYVTLRQPRAALDTLTEYMASQPKTRWLGMATLWRRAESGWRLVTDVELLPELVLLAASIASSEGWLSEERSWRDMLLELPPPRGAIEA